MEKNTKIYSLFLSIIILILLLFNSFLYFSRNRQTILFNHKILSSVKIDGKIIDSFRVNNHVVKYMIYFEKNEKNNTKLSNIDMLDERGVLLVLEVLGYGLPFKFLALYHLDGRLLNVFYDKIPLSDIFLKNIITLYQDDYEILPDRVEYHVFNVLKLGAQFVRTGGYQNNE